MEKTNIYYEQFSTLLKLAKKRHKAMMALVGEKIEDEPNETFEIYHPYPLKYANKIMHPKGFYYWDIPEYSNGSTRNARCLFLLPSHAVADAMYPYLIRDNSEMEAKYALTPGYDRDRLLITETIGNDEIEIIWSFDYKKPSKHGNYWYSIDKFWFGVRVNGLVLHQDKKIKDLIKIDL